VSWWRISYSIFNTIFGFTQRFELFDKIMDFRGKGRPFGSGYPFQPQTALINPQQSQDFPGFFDDRLTSHITFQVMAVADVSAGHQQPVDSLKKSLQQKAVVDPAGAHHTDQAYIAGILYARYTRQVGTGVRAPVANKGQNLGLFFSSHRSS
jgi:hypothetical protein